ncbi:MAG TPA: RDD family protein [Candidatus Dormibacteraeota bacterium]
MGEVPRQISPDGKFYWDGARWQPLDARHSGYPAPAGYGYAQQPRVVFGGLLIRFVAYLIDSLIIGFPLAILFGVLAAAGVLGSPVSPNDLPAPPPGGTATGAFTLSPAAIFWFYLFGLLVSAAYYASFWGTSGATLGMRLFELRVVDADSGQPIGIGRAIVRFIGFIVAAFPCWIGLIWSAFDPRAQGWHDKIASTVVLQSRAA